MKILQITPLENSFTSLLTEIPTPPKQIYYIGTLPPERKPAVAIVGTRRPTKYGEEVTRRLAYDLAKRGVVIVSGMALGVDGIAHRAALEAGGTTIAVQANGLSKISPSSHRQLGIDILASGGAIISEYEPTMPAMQYRFLERNRLVSGLSDAIIITEAAARSGTLNTAACALEQGREVFVVPGNITSPLSAGCNTLIKQGAMPAACAEDVLEVIAPSLLSTQATLALGDNPLQIHILELLASGVRDGDELLAATSATASQFSTELTMLELNGQVRALGANQWTLK